MLGYIGIGVSLIATCALGYLLGSISRNKKVEKLLAAAEEEAEQMKKEKLLEARQKTQELREERRRARKGVKRS